MATSRDYFKEDQDYTFNDPFEDDKYEDFSVNPMAESTLDIVAKIILIFGAAVGVLIWIAAFMSDEPLHMIVGFIAGLIAFFLQGLLPWACIKVVLNMSNNLHSIREELRQLKKS
jgi:F0F1-type ATP synthase assembly protein I